MLLFYTLFFTLVLMYYKNEQSKYEFANKHVSYYPNNKEQILSLNTNQYYNLINYSKNKNITKMIENDKIREVVNKFDSKFIFECSTNDLFKIIDYCANANNQYTINKVYQIVLLRYIHRLN